MKTYKAKLLATIRALNDDKSGAAMVEYTALLGVILGVTVAVLVAVGGWAGTVWSGLCTALDGASIGGASCTP